MSMQLVLTVILVIGIVFFMAGMHGIDNAWNLAYVEKATGENWLDVTLFGHGMLPEQIYRQSVFITMAGFIVSVVSGLSIYGRK